MAHAPPDEILNLTTLIRHRPPSRQGLGQGTLILSCKECKQVRDMDTPLHLKNLVHHISYHH